MRPTVSILTTGVGPNQASGVGPVPLDKPINPAALFSSGKSFNVLWAEAVAAESNPANVYSLGPCIEVGPKWYFYLTP
jgi:hypothetical protein